MPGLDGIRAFAVFAVIAYHLNFEWASGGFLGVTIFFVLSGYLITDLLIREWGILDGLTCGIFGASVSNVCCQDRSLYQ